LGAKLVPQETQETIFTAYKYSCSERGGPYEMDDIKVIVIPVSGKALSCCTAMLVVCYDYEHVHL